MFEHSRNACHSDKKCSYSYGNARQKLFYAWDFFLVWMACKFSVAINTLLNFMYPMSFYKLGDHILFIFPIQAQT